MGTGRLGRTHEAEEALALLVVLAGHLEVALGELLSLLGVASLERGQREGMSPESGIDCPFDGETIGEMRR